MRQGAYESIITYKKQFNNALKAYVDQGNPSMDQKDIAMDFSMAQTIQDMEDLKQRQSMGLPPRQLISLRI